MAPTRTMLHFQDSARALRTAIPYLREYKGRVFVVKLGGRQCMPGRTLAHLVDQLTLLYQVGIRVVVVHGAGEQATELARRFGHEPQIVAGRRVTDDPMLEIAKMSFAGTVNTDVVAAFRKAQVPAVGVSGIDGGLVVAHKRPVQEIRDPAEGTTRTVDFGHVGDVVRVDPAMITHLLSGEFVPVVCSLAADEHGNVLNINADTVAAKIAAALHAAKYFLVTDVDGVLRDRQDHASLLSYLDLAELDDLVNSGAVGGGMLPKLAACREALLAGVSRVHIVNGAVPDSLLGEVFTNEGSGTLLVRERSDRENGGTPT